MATTGGKASGQGKGRVDQVKPSPKKGNRQSKGPSLPSAKPPSANKTPQNPWGAHLQ
jgi:hypothetical protein